MSPFLLHQSAGFHALGYNHKTLKSPQVHRQESQTSATPHSNLQHPLLVRVGRIIWLAWVRDTSVGFSWDLTRIVHSYILLSDYPGGAMNDQDSVIDQIVHISCQHCKHFHKNLEFSLPPSGGRVKCARCQTDMFRLGRADTQVTLASVESFPLSRHGTDAASVPAGHSAVPQSQSGIFAPPPSEHSARQLHPFSGRRQAMTSAGSQLDGVDLHSPDMQSAIQDNSYGIRRPSHHVPSLYLTVLQKLAYLESFLGAFGYMKTLGTRFTAGLPQIRREYSIFGWRFVIHPPDNHDDDHSSASMNTTQHDNETTSAGIQTHTAISNESLDRTSPDVPSTPPPIETATHSAGATPTNESGNALSAIGRPSPRLIQHRRKKTLVRDALQKLNCRCRGDCHCVLRTVEPQTSDSELDDAQSSRFRTPPHPDDVPSNPVYGRPGVQQFLLLSHLGHSTQSSDHSLNTSQASTLGSSGSLVLRPARPRLIGRSRSMPPH